MPHTTLLTHSHDDCTHAICKMPSGYIYTRTTGSLSITAPTLADLLSVVLRLGGLGCDLLAKIDNLINNF